MLNNFSTEDLFIPFYGGVDQLIFRRVNKGYKLVKPGYKISWQELNTMADGLKDDFPLKKGSYWIAVPRKERDPIDPNASLLIPLGPDNYGVRPFSSNEKPLFQSFIDLTSEEEILAFAFTYGRLGAMGLNWDIEAGQVFLESTDFWRKEISAMKVIIEAAACCEASSSFEKMVPFWETAVRKNDPNIINLFPFFFKLFSSCIFSKEHMGSLHNESRKITLFRIVASCCTVKLSEHDCYPCYSISRNGRPEAGIDTTRLAGALWLELIHSIFKDGPEHMIAHRCFYCGRYDREGMHQRKKDPNAGLWYHETCKCAFYNRMRRRKEREQREKGMESKKHK